MKTQPRARMGRGHPGEKSGYGRIGSGSAAGCTGVSGGRGNENNGRLRGRWFSYSTPGMPRPAHATAVYHPAYLLRTPTQKRNTWRDLLAIKEKLESL